MFSSAFTPLRLVLLLATVALASSSYGRPEELHFLGDSPSNNEQLLREMVNRIGNELVDPEAAELLMEAPPREHRMELPLSSVPVMSISPRGMGVVPSEEEPPPSDYDEDLAIGNPSLRDREYLKHSSLLASLLGMFQGNNAEKTLQRNKPLAELTADSSGLPAYCNPPNPCPLGHTADKGCIEDFENSAAFSRAYQSRQECMCDTEHMFQCADSDTESEAEAFANAINNKEEQYEDTIDKLLERMGVLDKFSPDHIVSNKYQSSRLNPFLQGEKLPIAAKKGIRF